MTFSKRPERERERDAEAFLDMIDPGRMKVLYIRAPESMWYDLKRLSKQSHWSMNDLCLKMIRESLEKENG